MRKAEFSRLITDNPQDLCLPITFFGGSLTPEVPWGPRAPHLPAGALPYSYVKRPKPSPGLRRGWDWDFGGAASSPDFALPHL